MDEIPQRNLIVASALRLRNQCFLLCRIAGREYRVYRLLTEGGYNLYAFVGNLPVYEIDLLGLSKDCGIYVHLSHFRSTELAQKIESQRELGTCSYFFPFTCWARDYYDELGDRRLPGMPREEYWDKSIGPWDSDRWISVESAFSRLRPYVISAAEGMCETPCCCPGVHITFSWDDSPEALLHDRAREFPWMPAVLLARSEDETDRLVSANVLDTNWYLDCGTKVWVIAVVFEPDFELRE